MDSEVEKRAAARRALKLLDGIELLGLGSGTTVAIFVQELARTDYASRIKALPSSRQIEGVARRYGIELVDPSYGKPELTVDGADEIDSHLNLLKGGGGALVREKVLATSSDHYVIIADHSKLVDKLCTKKSLPVEVLPFGHEWTKELLEKALGSEAKLRKSGNRIFVSDNGNYIVDVACRPLDDPSSVEKSIKLHPGVVEVGIFTDLADEVLVAFGEDVKELVP